MTRAAHFVVAASLLIGLRPLAAQSLGDRMASAQDGAVTFHYTARRGVCGDGESFVRTGRHSFHGSWSGGRMEPCYEGPVQVRLTIVDGRVTRIQSWVGRLRDRAGRDLGRVSALEAASFLMDVAAREAPGVSTKAIFPAVLADSARVWPALLAIARDESRRSRQTRKEAMLWLSRFASGALAGFPDDPFVEDESEDAEEDFRVHAVFVLSQLRNGEGIPDLLQVARSNSSRRVRSQALFWLGQSGDPRALDLFESVLRS